MSHAEQPEVAGNYPALLLSLQKLPDGTESFPFQRKHPELCRGHRQVLPPVLPACLVLQLYLLGVVGMVTVTLPQTTNPLGSTCHWSSGRLHVAIKLIFDRSYLEGLFLYGRTHFKKEPIFISPVGLGNKSLTRLKDIIETD